MLVDSHCHLDFPEFEGRMEYIRGEMAAQGVGHALCVSVSLSGWERVHQLARKYDNFYASVGVHPDHEPDSTGAESLTVSDLVLRAQNPEVVAIGETGLDYYRQRGDLEWQRQRFRTHIRAAREAGLPLIIHTREAARDTVAIMREEGADRVGGVMHCFTETAEVAAAALELNFYVSFSGIVTFKNAIEIKDVARRVPLDRLLVETDAPYLAPVPFRGETNHPALVRYVAEEIARLHGIGFEAVADATTRNFFTLFERARN
ncbi:MAG: DNAase [Betaproteobacteria bacterium RIFCSPLOWO2_12_FULL_63_13]|nr:MAG: DNAase [Betaproteobacteria bacterium RIFCSPLOWO2_12_FULL_63_13]